MKSEVKAVVMENPAKEKSKAFAVRIVNLYKYITDNYKDYTIAKQILRSGTSIGANLAEAECAISRKNFTAKVYIALKECSETGFWLELLYKTEYIDQKAYDSINADCQELMRILSASTITLTKGKNNKEED